MRTIVTERLRLEPVTPKTAPVLWRVLQAQDLRTYQDLPEIDEAHFVRTVASRPQQFDPGVAGRFEWIVYLEGVADAVGWVSIRVGERAGVNGEIGYSVVREYRNRGIATEAVRALIDEAFSRAQLRRVRAYCVPENQASRAVLERAGLTDDGVLPHGATVRGTPVDVLSFVLDRIHWEEARGAGRTSS